MLYKMGQSEYGLYSLTVTVVGYLTILDFGFGSAVVRYTAQYRALEDKDKEFNLNGMFFIIYTAIGIVTALAGIVLFLKADAMFSANMTAAEINKAKILILLLVFNLAASFPLGIFSSIVTAYEEFIFSKLINIVRILISPCILIPLLFIGYRAVGMAAATTVLNLIILLVNTWFCLSKLKIKISFKHLDFGLLAEIAAFSFYGFLNIIVDRITWGAGQFILGVVSGTAAVAVYSVAMQINNYYLSFSTAISGLFLPKLTSMFTNGATDKEFSDLFIKIGRIQYIIIAYILGGFLLVGKDFINVWAGPGYEQAFYITCIIMIPVTFPLIQNTGISILQAQNRQRFRSLMYLAFAAVNIAVSIPLGQMYGGVGCAAGTAFALVCGSIVTMNIYYHKQIHLDIPRFWKEIIRMTVPIAAAFFVCCAVGKLIAGNGIVTILIITVIYTAAYIPLIWFMGMNEYEKELFTSLVRKTRKKSTAPPVEEDATMIDGIERIKCTGCKMCSDICPSGAISYHSDKKGFWYPVVDYGKCIGCRQCIDTCPALTDKENKKHYPEVYSAWLKEDGKRLQSTSGGIYYALAKHYIDEGKFIVGAQYTEDCKGAFHTAANSEDGLEKLIGSKYVQSDTAGIYNEIKARLDSGEEVLFCGTPCQSAALQNYLKKPYSNLMTVDFICRGVSSPRVYVEYIEELERKFRSAVKSVHMKNKRAGWQSLGILIKFRNGKEYFRKGKDDLWIRGYLQENLYTRPSCFHCKYKVLPRVSDLSLGDFWGLQGAKKDDLLKGISLVMINTAKGNELFLRIKEDIVVKERTLLEAIKGNPSILMNDCIGRNSGTFFKLLDEMSVSESVKKCIKHKRSKAAERKPR